MRKVLHKSLNKYRCTHPTLGRSPDNTDCGYFEVGGLCIISSGTALCDPSDRNTFWDHVSVSMPDRCPTWAEMCFVKDLFWSKDETVIQFHSRLENYKNDHEFCLHLWKKAGDNVELPPSICV